MYGNRGMALENMINDANSYYFNRKQALIQKIPTPVKVLNINPRTGKITNAFYEKKSTVDYIGCWRGRSVAFEAKSTKITTRFDLKNLDKHQYNWLEYWNEQGGLAFIILFFESREEIYLLPFQLLQEYWEAAKVGGRKSITYKEIAKSEYRIRNSGLILCDYLSVLENITEGA